MTKVTDFETLDEIDGTEVLYAVKDGKDYQVKIETIKDSIAERPQEIKLEEFKW